MASAKAMSAVVVVRHGERLDYVMRDTGQGNWIQSNQHVPWDPPLTSNGKDQAAQLGRSLRSVLTSLSLPTTVQCVYSSPFLRCRQTGAWIIKGLLESREDHYDYDDLSDHLKVKVEYGLSESINENWYRSWAVPGTDGTWGYRKQDLPNHDIDTLHPAARAPVQPLLLGWKRRGCDRPDDDNVSDSDEEDKALQYLTDFNHQSTTTIDVPYSYSTKTFESFKTQRKRMADTLNALANRHAGQTIILISHGGPVTHLYENLTGNHWDVHGESKYCCFSIYQKLETDNGDEEVNDKTLQQGQKDNSIVGGSESKQSTNGIANGSQWNPLVVNRVLWDDDGGKLKGDEEKTKSTKKSSSFQWS